VSQVLPCPHCKGDIFVDAIAAVGNDQRFIWAVKPTEGAMMQAQAIGGQLVTLDKMMKAIAREDGGKVRTYIEKVDMEADGTVAFHIAVLPVRSAQAPR
jgi:hypothetical protein